jgi:hypothetical protein
LSSDNQNLVLDGAAPVGGAEPPAGVLPMDRLAPVLLARASPVRIRVAESVADLEAGFRLRFRAAAERAWLDTTDCPDGLERDTFDERAVAVLACDGDAAIATVRLVFPCPGRLLPTEHNFAVRTTPAGRTVDVGRLVIAPPFGGPSHRVLLGLLGQVWLVMRERGFSQACGSITRPMARLYRGMGLGVIDLGPPKTVWGERRSPVLVPRGSFDRLARGWIDRPNGGD